MRGSALFAACAVIAVLLQTTVLPAMAGLPAAPDLLLIFCVYLGLHQHTVGGAFGAFVLGYLQDALSGSFLGLNAFGMCLVFTLVYLTSRRLWVDNAVSKIVVVFFAALVKTAAMVGLIAVFLSTDGLWRGVARYLMLEAALAAVLSPPLFAVLARTQAVGARAEP